MRSSSRSRGRSRQVLADLDAIGLGEKQLRRWGGDSGQAVARGLRQSTGAQGATPDPGRSLPETACRN